MEACRAQGFAARFVSGYYEGDTKNPQKDLHAWSEVFVEGGGWRGFDPSIGLAVAETHVPIAAASFAELVAPVIGVFRGNDASSRMQAGAQLVRVG